MLGSMPATAYADKQDGDLADRVYEKYKKRQEKGVKPDDLANRRGADDRSGNNDSGRSYERAQRFSLDQAVNMVRREYGGKVIRAESRNSGGKLVHYVKVHTDNGRVRTFKVDASSGQIR